MKAISRQVRFPYAARTMGMRIVGTRGSGKSRLAGRLFAVHDFAHGYPVVVIDPGGALVDNILDVLLRLSEKQQQAAKLKDRVVYVDVAGSYSMGYVAPFPALIRRADQPLMSAANLWLNTCLKTDPDLHRNPQLGATSLIRIGSYAGAICAALGWQLTEITALLDDPKRFQGQLLAALQRYPDELAEAVHFFLDIYPALRPQDRLLQTNSLRGKLHMLANPVARAMYGASTPAVDWDEVVAKRQLVLLDFRNVEPLHKRFTVAYLHDGLMDWIRRRGPGRHVPLSVYVDEVTFLLGDATDRTDPVADDLEELISQLSRNNRVWLTYIHQEINQLNEKSRRLFNDLGIQLFGRTADIETAMAVAQCFYRWRGDEVRKTTLTYHPMTRYEAAWYQEETTEYTREEMNYLNALPFLDLADGQFLVGVAPREGVLPTSLGKIDISRYQAGQYVQEELVAQCRTRLMQQHRRVDEVLAEIRQRQDAPSLPPTLQDATPRLPFV